MHLLIPYMEKWVKGLNWHIVMNNSTNSNDNDKALYLTWVIGEGRWFPRLLPRVAYDTTVDDDGILLDSRRKPWKNQLGFPKRILGKHFDHIHCVLLTQSNMPSTDLIAQTRLNSLEKMLSAISTSFQELLDAPHQHSLKLCRGKNATDDIKEQCQLQQLGSVISGLTAAGLMPLPDPKKYSGSVKELAKKLESVKVAHYRMPGIKPHQDVHSNCSIKHMQVVNDGMKAPIYLGDELIRELKLRSQKSGAYSNKLFRGLKESIPGHIEDLRRDDTHFKQVEDFCTSPDYGSLSYSPEEIKIAELDC